MIETVLDTVSLQHLLRKPKRKNGNSPDKEITSIDPLVAAGKLRLVLDMEAALVSEWTDTCDAEVVKILISFWEQHGGIKFIDVSTKVDRQVGRKLRQFGFTDTMDKHILRLTLSTDQKRLTSDDSDFWDPSKPGQVGDMNSPVAKLLSTQLGVKLRFLKTLMLEAS
ncbi:MAG: hypothetical protein EP340_03375 [Alphaproteobacteria bacterium]|nr:MAG: hypothetical protein EP340_03375 [Alphaproteobacteria bacterium]